MWWVWIVSWEDSFVDTKFRLEVLCNTGLICPEWNLNQCSKLTTYVDSGVLRIRDIVVASKVFAKIIRELACSNVRWANPFPLLCMTVTLFFFGVHLINCLQTFLIQIYHAHPQREACHPSGLTDINFWKNTKHLMSLSSAAGHFFPTANFCYQVFSTGLWHAQQDITLHFGSKNFCFVVFLHSQAIMRNIISEAAEGFVWIYVALVGLGFGFRQNIHVYVLGS